MSAQAPSIPFADYAMNENRYQALKITNPDNVQLPFFAENQDTVNSAHQS
ncbi:MAG: hypothetical protein M8357_16175 [Desulfobulbaceae bacterium]|nr:hypothetical protein [Desulfobulbaceae bacterium]